MNPPMIDHPRGPANRNWLPRVMGQLLVRQASRLSNSRLVSVPTGETPVVPHPVCDPLLPRRRPPTKALDRPRRMESACRLAGESLPRPHRESRKGDWSYLPGLAVAGVAVAALVVADLGVAWGRAPVRT